MTNNFRTTIKVSETNLIDTDNLAADVSATLLSDGVVLISQSLAPGNIDRICLTLGQIRQLADWRETPDTTKGATR